MEHIFKKYVYPKFKIVSNICADIYHRLSLVAVLRPEQAVLMDGGLKSGPLKLGLEFWEGVFTLYVSVVCGSWGWSDPSPSRAHSIS
jgi:hypothetical protein